MVRCGSRSLSGSKKWCGATGRIALPENVVCARVGWIT